jgi:integrase
MAIKVADAIPLFLESLEARGLSEGTIKRHHSALSGQDTIAPRSFLAAAMTLKGPNPTMGQLDQVVVARFLALTGGEQGNRNNRLDAVRQFFTWAESCKMLRPGLRADDVFNGYKARKAERKPKYYIPSADFPRALDIAGARDRKDRAVIAFLLGTLARDGEAAAVQLKHLDLSELSVQLYRTKRKRWTTTGVNPDLADEMQSWGDRYAHEFGYVGFQAMRAAHPDWYLLPPRTAKNMGFKLDPTRPPTTLPRVVKRVLTGLGVVGTEHSEHTEHVGEGVHTIRRSGARSLYEFLLLTVGHDSSLAFVQAMLDHQTPEITVKYIGVDWHKDQLNRWLRGNRMYGGTPDAGAIDSTGAQVIQLRREA